MIESIIVRDRGTTPRSLRKVWTASSAEAFATAGQYFHDHFRDRRFTEAHARAAGYKRRKGELQAYGSKAFWRSYTGRKLKYQGHMRPLEYSGKTRDRIKTMYRITSNSKRGRVTYRGANTFSRRHAKSQIRMQDEFRRLLPEELIQLGQVYDAKLDELLGDSNWQSSTTVA
ncbi:hypothetical protein [Crateriforma conspicua]|uniref:Phage virion morphogenesis family protein n=1 Tax=Crateriforma conspicua TaxID=2527996 RepID=A0A5C6FVL2_9PLAN|nr:hypothetical protein [Crateriforma conspicua]TWU66451.1 hypothetical protein V7x_20170 [Crateriforma conspicua]